MMAEQKLPKNGDWDGLPRISASNFWVRSPNWQILKRNNGKSIQLVWQLLPSILAEESDEQMRRLQAGLAISSAYTALLNGLPTKEDAAIIWPIDSPGKTKPLLSPTAYGLPPSYSTMASLEEARGTFLFYYNVPDAPLELGLNINGGNDIEKYLTAICTALSRLHNLGVYHLGLGIDTLLRVGKDYWLAAILPDVRILSQFDGLNHQDLLQPHAPPELWDRSGDIPIGPQTDIYMAAALAIQAYSKTNFPTIKERINSSNPQADIRKMLDGAKADDPITPVLADALVNAVALKVDDRPQSVAQWRKAFALAPNKSIAPMAVTEKAAARAAPLQTKNPIETADNEKPKGIVIPGPTEIEEPDTPKPSSSKNSGFGLILALGSVAIAGYAIYEANNAPAELDLPPLVDKDAREEVAAAEPEPPVPPPDPVLAKVQNPIYMDDANERLTDLSVFTQKFRLVEDDDCSYPLAIRFTDPLEEYSTPGDRRQIVLAFPDGWTWTTKLRRGNSEPVKRDRAAWDAMQEQQQYRFSVRGQQITDENNQPSANGDAYIGTMARIIFNRDSDELIIASDDVNRGPYTVCE